MSKPGDLWEFESLFTKKRRAQIEIMDRMVLPVLVGISILVLLSFCRKNSERRQCITLFSMKRTVWFFARSLWSIKTSNAFSIYKTQRGVDFWSENINIFWKCFLIGRPNRGLRYLYQEQYFGWLFRNWNPCLFICSCYFWHYV